MNVFKGTFKGLPMIVEQCPRTSHLFIRWAGAGFHLSDVTIPGLREAALKLLTPPNVPLQEENPNE